MHTQPAALQFLLVLVSSWANRELQAAIDYLVEENRILRERLGDQRVRFTSVERRRLATRGKAVSRRLLDQIATLASPDTILRWYRELIACKYDGTDRQSTRGPSKARRTTSEIVVSMARDNPTWGYTRIRAALTHLGHRIGRNTIKRILIANGIDPAPNRGARTPWSTFLKAHWGAIAAADFFTVEVLTLTGLVRHVVFFAIDLKTRAVEVLGISATPDGDWMLQLARNATDGVDGFLRNTNLLIVDRDPLYTAAFAKTLRVSRCSLLRLPARSPNLNAFAERFVLSIKSECLDRVVPLGEQHLRYLIAEYLAHYHRERHHQGLDSALVMPSPDDASGTGAIERRERLGGLLNFYQRAA